MKKIVMIFIGSIQLFTSFAQNTFPDKNIAIIHEYSYSSSPISESTKPQDLVNQNIKVETQKQSAAQYFSVKQFDFKPNAESANLSISTLRIKVKNADMDIDTDVPFATSEGNKMAMDHYLGLLEKENKINYSKYKNVSDKSKGLSISTIPLLHPIYDLSGVLLDIQFVLNVGHTWIDTLENLDGKFINSYKVLKNDGEKATLVLNGSLNPNNEKIVVEPFDRAKHVPGSGIQAKIKISLFEYNGELIVDNKNFIIEKCSLKTKKDMTIITPFQGTQRVNSYELEIKNKVK